MHATQETPGIDYFGQSHCCSEGCHKKSFSLVISWSIILIFTRILTINEQGLYASS